MKIYLKRLLTVLVAVAMLFTLAMPAMVFADVEEEQDSAEDMNLSEDPEGSEEGEEPEEVVEPEESEEAVEPEEPEESEEEETLPQIIIQSVEVQSEEEIVSAESYANGGEVGGVVGNNDPQDPGEGEGTENEGPDETVTLEVQDGDDITSILKSTLNRAPLADDGVLTIIIPEGSYTITQDLPVFSNTTIIATGATIKSLKADGGSMLWGSHKVDGARCTGKDCTHGGYTQHENITIDGGTWIRDENGEFTGYKTSIFGFRHGRNLTITNVTAEKATDHFFNLSGMDNVTVYNCTLKDARQCTGSSEAGYWGKHTGDKAINRFNSIEAIHFDYCSYASESGDRGYPLDGTPAGNVTISNCNFQGVHSGIGTHHTVDVPDKNPEGFVPQMAIKLVVQNCNADDIQGYFVYAYDFKDTQILNNTITNGNGLADIEATPANKALSVATISGNTLETRSSFVKYFDRDGVNNTITGNHGIKAIDATVSMSNNKFYNVGQSGIYMEGAVLTATKNTVSKAAEMGVVAKAGTRVTCTSNTISGSGQSGIKAEGESAITAKSNTISNSGDQGIFIYGATSTLESNTISGTAQDGINVKASTKTTIKSNNISGVVRFGMYITNTPSTISGNTVAGSGSGKPAIKVEGAKTTLADNIINSSDKDAIVVEAADKSIVRGNNVKGAKEVGILIKNSKSVRVTSNTVKNTKGHAFLMSGTEAKPSSSALISNNTFVTGVPASKFDLRLGDYATKCSIEPNTLGNKKTSFSAKSSHTDVKKGTLTSEVKDGQYYYDGYKNNTFTGLAPDAAGKYLFVRKGKFEKFTGLAISIKDDKYYFAKDGKYYNKFTGLAQSAHAKGYYFVRAGKYDKTFTGLALSAHATGYYFVRNGKYDAKFTGLAQSIKDNKYYYAKNGKYDNTFTGIATSATAKGQYYVVKGAWNKKFTGKVKYNKKTYNVVKGVVK